MPWDHSVFGTDAGFVTLQKANPCPLQLSRGHKLSTGDVSNSKTPVIREPRIGPIQPGAGQCSQLHLSVAVPCLCCLVTSCLFSLFHLPRSLIDSVSWPRGRGVIGRDLKGGGLADFTRSSSQTLIPGLWGQRGSCDLLRLSSCREQAAGLPSIGSCLKCSIEQRKHRISI